MSYQKHCPGCFEQKAHAAVCPHCGYDESSERSPVFLPHGMVLVGQYRVGKVLGKPGGFGITYLGWDVNLHQRVAIKEYLPRDIAGRSSASPDVTMHTSADRESFEFGREQFVREARIVAQLDHPNIVGVRGFFKANGTAYLVMDYYEGLSLGDYLTTMRARIEPQIAVGVLLPILEGLEYVHARGVVHRDIKPANVYLASMGRAILLDFGAARQAAGERVQSISVVMTEGYAPLEQYQRRAAQGPWTDVYGLAATLFRTITGYPPPAALDRMGADPMVPQFEQLPPALRPILARAMSLKSEDRYQTAAEFRQALESVKGLLEGFAPPSVAAPIEDRLSEAEPVTLPRPEALTTVRPVKSAAPVATAPPQAIETPAPSAPAVPVAAAMPDPPPQPRSMHLPHAHEPVPLPKGNAPAATRRVNPVLAVAAVCVLAAAGLWWQMGRETAGTTVPTRSAQSVAAAPAAPVAPTTAEPEPVATPAPSSQAAATHPEYIVAPPPALSASSTPSRVLPLMVGIPGGVFQMGDETVPAERPVHEVRVAPFKMSLTEITVAQFRSFVENTDYENPRWGNYPCETSGGRFPDWRAPGYDQTDDHPVVCVNWEDARAYARWLSRETGELFRLPTEAEWEFAARAGTVTPAWWGAVEEEGRANCAACKPLRNSPLKVRSFTANPLGLFEMNGNVREWTCSMYAPYGRGTDTVCGTPVEESRAVIRGGSWQEPMSSLRSSARESFLPYRRNVWTGFRIVQELSGAE